MQNEKSNELRTKPWLTGLGGGSRVHEEIGKWLERSTEKRESGLTRSQGNKGSLEGFLG